MPRNIFKKLITKIIQLYFNPFFNKKSKLIFLSFQNSNLKTNFITNDLKLKINNQINF